MEYYRGHQQRQGNSNAETWASCGPCLRAVEDGGVDRGIRAAWGCGWLPASERTGPGMAPPQAQIEASVCCGYTIRLPEVFEAARALAWRRDGQVREFYGDDEITDIAKDAIDAMAIEQARVQQFVVAGGDKGNS